MPIESNTLSLNQFQKDSIKNKLSELTSALYETAKWMLVNNKDSASQPIASGIK
jgi:hypothetical protein